MTSNPTAQYVAIPDISSQNEKTLLRIFRMFHSGNITGLNVCDRAILCVWRKVQNDLSVGLSTVKQLSFFIQDLCKSGFWGTKESYAEIILFFKFNCCILHQSYFYSMSKGLTSSSQIGRMTSQSASHHAESNSTKTLLFVPKPNLWMECILLRGRGGENSVE